MAENKLLEKAASFRSVRAGTILALPVTKDEVEMAIAYLEGKITLRQYSKALEMDNPGNGSHRITVALLRGVREGWVKITLL